MEGTLKMVCIWERKTGSFFLRFSRILNLSSTIFMFLAINISPLSSFSFSAGFTIFVAAVFFCTFFFFKLTTPLGKISSIGLRNLLASLMFNWVEGDKLVAFRPFWEVVLKVFTGVSVGFFSFLFKSFELDCWVILPLRLFLWILRGKGLSEVLLNRLETECG